MMRGLCILASALIALTSVQHACADEVVLATWGGKFAEVFQKTMIAPFEKATGHKVKMIYGGSLPNKQALAAAAKNPQVDVIMLTLTDAIDAVQRDLTQPLDAKTFPVLAKLPNRGIAKVGDKVGGIGLWTYGLGIFVRTDKVDWPIRSWDDIWDRRLKRKVALPSPKYGEAIFLVSINRVAGGQGKDVGPAIQKLRKLGDNVALEFEGSVALMQQLAQGEVWVAPLMSITAGAAIVDGIPGKFVVPKEGSAATIDVMTLVKGAPHRKAAIEFINFATDAGPVGATCVDLRLNCLHPGARENPAALLKPSDIEAMYNVDADLVNRNKGDWLEIWNKEITPLFRQ
jgi:putative spermidine/putrescine transport system substrate-binding protein